MFTETLQRLWRPTSARSTCSPRRLARLAAVVFGAASLLTTAATAATVTPIETGQRDTTALLFSGPIQAGDLGRLRTAIGQVAVGQRVLLILESGGGLISEGLAIGRFVHANRIATSVPAGPGCHSACTLIFLGGRDVRTGKPARIMMSGARIGFHQAAAQVPRGGMPPTAVDLAAVQTGVQTAIAQIDAYFRELAIPGEFLSLTLSAANSTVTLLRELDALRLGIFVMDPSTGRLLTPEGFNQQVSTR